MSNAVTLNNARLPAHLADRLGKPSNLNSALGGGIGGSSTPRISVKGSRFRIVEGGAETLINSLTLDVVIVGANPSLSKLWYEGTWSPDSEPGAPDCFSLNGIRPDTESKKPQSDNCATCPQNQWGSKITPQGQKIKACADQKRLAVVPADDPSSSIYLLQVTPAALKGLNQYHKELSLRSIPVECVRTQLGFDTSASFPKLTFKFAGFLDEAAQAEVDAVIGTHEVMEVTGENVAAPIKPLEIERPSPVRPKVEPVIEDAVIEEVTPAVETKRGFGAAKTVTPPPAQPAQTKRVVTEPPAAKAVSSDDLLNNINKLLDDMNDE